MDFSNILQAIPKEFTDLLIVLGFSLLIGMEQKRHYQLKNKTTFGTDRTFTFIGLMGYLLALQTYIAFFLVGLVILGGFFALFYQRKMVEKQGYGLTTEILALLIYIMPLIVIQQAHWLSILVYVLLLVLAEMKGYFEKLSQKIDSNEFFTLSKFIVMAGIILPILPKEEISPFIPVSAYRIWLAVVVISGISYASYILKKYIFPHAGLWLTGVLGGLYSSTASTAIVARQSHDQLHSPGQYAGSIIVATSMMYLRLWVLALVFNHNSAFSILPYFLAVFLISLGVAFYLYQSQGNPVVTASHESINHENTNPLEFKIALVFSVLYIVFTSLTYFINQHYGDAGLKILSLLVGFTDIDPFLINLFQSNHDITINLLILATLQATFSNNILKAILGISLSAPPTRTKLILGFGIIIVVNIALILMNYGQQMP